MGSFLCCRQQCFSISYWAEEEFEEVSPPLAYEPTEEMQPDFVLEGLFRPIPQFTNDPLCAIAQRSSVKMSWNTEETRSPGTFHFLRPQHCIEVAVSGVPPAVVILLQTFKLDCCGDD